MSGIAVAAREGSDLSGPWTGQWLSEIPRLAPAVSGLVGETREATEQALHQATAVVLARIACMARRAEGTARLRGMLRLPGADASLVPELGTVLDDERECEALMKAGAEALGGLFGPHRIAPLAGAISTHARMRHRASAAHVLELVAAIVLARINAFAKEHRLDMAGLKPPLSGARREAWLAVAPRVAETIGDERDEPWCERPAGDDLAPVFHAPPGPSVAARVLAWSALMAAVSSVVLAAFLL